MDKFSCPVNYMGQEKLSDRLKEELQRLGLSFARVGEICGVSKNTAVSWGQGSKLPAEALASLIAHGADSLYVLTGTRSDTSGYNSERGTDGHPKDVDLSLLRDVIQVTEEALEQTGRMMQPDKKAEFISGLYSLYLDTDAEKVDKNAVLRLVKSAA